MQSPYAPNFLEVRKRKVFKIVNILSMSTLVLHMSLGAALAGVFLVAPNNVLACHGGITVIKDTGGISSPEFSFSSTGPEAPGSFSLAGGEQWNNNRIHGGIYVFTEAAMSGWTLTDIVCTGDANVQTDIPNGTVTIDLDDGEDVVCTFYNEEDAPGPFCGDGVVNGNEECDDGNNIDGDGCSANCTWQGKLIVKKVVAGGGATSSDWLMDISQMYNFPGSLEGTSQLVVPGMYIVTESDGPAGYDLTYGGDCGIDGHVSVGTTSPAVCVLTNTYTPPTGSITICKYYDNGIIGTYETATDTPLAWSFVVRRGSSTINIDTNGEDDCETVSGIPLGNYIVSEIPRAGDWVNSLPGGGVYNITLTAATSSSVLVFLNYEATSSESIIVVKKIVQGGTATSSDWTMYLSGVGDFPGSADGTATTVSPGVYQVTESGAPADYVLSYSGACDSQGNINISAGETKVCVLTNIYNPTPPSCGDGQVDEEEECDDNGQNGVPCTPGYGETCTYCSGICQKITLTGPYCGDGVVNGAEQCDDGNNVGGDGCSASCTTEGGGGGGGGYVFLQIMDIKATCTAENTAVVEWRTNKSVTSWVVYGLDSNDINDATSTETTSASTRHSVVIDGLKPKIDYYFTATAFEGTQKVKKTVKYNTNDCIRVKGEEGEPILVISKAVAQELVNPGDKNVEYTITVTNKGNLTSFDTVITDTLPTGLTFSEDGSMKKIWEIGDLEPDQSREITYFADVSPDAKPMVYINTAVASSANHGPVSDVANVDIRQVKVLAETGFNAGEFAFLIMFVLGSLGSISFLKRRIIEIN